MKKQLIGTSVAALLAVVIAMVPMTASVAGIRKGPCYMPTKTCDKHGKCIVTYKEASRVLKRKCAEMGGLTSMPKTTTTTTTTSSHY